MTAAPSPAASALTFTAHGQPAPQGSKRYVGRGIVVENSTKVRPWRTAVTAAAITAAETAEITTPLQGPLAVTATFVLPRPHGHYRTGRNAHLLREGAPMAPHRTPDLDKLVRSTLDALTDAGLWHDDAQVVDLSAAKTYPGAGSTGLSHPGAVLTVQTLTIPTPQPEPATAVTGLPLDDLLTISATASDHLDDPRRRDDGHGDPSSAQRAAVRLIRAHCAAFRARPQDYSSAERTVLAQLARWKPTGPLPPLPAGLPELLAEATPRLSSTSATRSPARPTTHSTTAGQEPA